MGIVAKLRRGFEDIGHDNPAERPLLKGDQGWERGAMYVLGFTSITRLDAVVHVSDSHTSSTPVTKYLGQNTPKSYSLVHTRCLL